MNVLTPFGDPVHAEDAGTIAVGMYACFSFSLGWHGIWAIHISTGFHGKGTENHGKLANSTRTVWMATGYYQNFLGTLCGCDHGNDVCTGGGNKSREILTIFPRGYFQKKGLNSMSLTKKINVSSGNHEIHGNKRHAPTFKGTWYDFKFKRWYSCTNRDNKIKKNISCLLGFRIEASGFLHVRIELRKKYNISCVLGFSVPPAVSLLQTKSWVRVRLVFFVLQWQSSWFDQQRKERRFQHKVVLRVLLE